MAKIITLTDLVIEQIRIDYNRQSVNVLYSLVDSNNVSWSKGEAVFWVTIPEGVNGGLNNPTWFQLPPEYITLLINLKEDADIALTNALLV